MNRVVRVSLQIALVAIFAAVLFVAHSYIAVAASELPYLFKDRPVMLTALLASSVLAALATATIFAYPVARVFGRFAPLVALAICIPTVVYRTSQIADTSGKPFVVSTLVLEAVALVVLVPLGAWVLIRRRYAA